MRLFILLFPLRDSYGTLCFKKVLYGKIQIDFGTGSFETFYFIVPFTRLIWRMYPIKENIAESRKVVHRYYLFVSASERFMFEQKNIARKSICSYVKLFKTSSKEGRRKAKDFTYSLSGSDSICDCL